MLDRSAENAVTISSVAETGIWAELVERLAALHFEPELSLTRLVVILPLVEGAGDRARELLAAGAPFDPGAWEIQEQQVFATDSEVVFVIEADDDGVLERRADNSMPWVAAPEWREIVAGAAHIVPAVCTWSRPQDEASGLSFEPTPGPGDSEGGDVFAP